MHSHNILNAFVEEQGAEVLCLMALLL